MNAACGKNNTAVLRDGETRTEPFRDQIFKEVLGDTFSTPVKMEGTLICAGSDPKITSIPHGVVYDLATIQLPLPKPIIDLDNPEPGDWPSIADKVSAEQGNDILNTCRDWIVKFLADFEQLEIPEKYWK